VAVPLYRQVGELRIPAALTGINPEAEGAEFWDATNGYTAYLGVSATAPRVPFTERSLKLYDGYKERYKTTPILTIGSYDSVLLLAEAIERAKTLDSDAVVAELEKTDFAGSKGRIVFDKRHDAIFGPGYVGYAALQWLPDGSHSIWWATKDENGDPYPGVSEFILPPWMIERWAPAK
jgi:branched-chain amino acid transport system substrate-binding protein